MKSVWVVYESQTGFTKRYAEWIGQKLQATVCPLAQWKGREDADLVIFGGSVHGGQISGLKKFRRRIRSADCPVLYFATGLRPVTRRTADLVKYTNFAGEEPALFCFSGGMDARRLSPGDRTLLRCYRAMLSRRRNLSEEDARTLERMQAFGDYTDREQIIPLLNLAETYLV